MSPSPWESTPNPPDGYIVRSMVDPTDKIAFVANEDNARAISATVEMMEAIEAVMDVLADDEWRLKRSMRPLDNLMSDKIAWCRKTLRTARDRARGAR